MSGSSVRHCQAIDQQLKNEYHEICFNPAKKHVLYRLTAPTHSDSTDESHLGSKMLQEYIDSTYQHYGIEDPIKREMRLAKRSIEIPCKPSPQKSLNQTQVSESDKLTRTKRTLISLKNSFKRDSSDVVYSSQLITQDSPHANPEFSARLNGSPVGRRRMNRQIGYKTKEKMHFKTLPREQSVRQTAKPLVLIQKKEQQRVCFNNQEQKHLSRHIPVDFRYCPMCEAAVLQCNIMHHESTCKEIQMAYKMPYAQIDAIIQDKIKRLEAEIQKEFVLRDEKKVTQDFNSLRHSVTLWMRQELPSRSLQKVQGQFDRFACGIYKKVNKLHWFKRLHNTISAKVSLQQAMLE